MYGNEVEPVFFEQPWYAGSQIFKRFNDRVEHLGNGEGSDRDVVVCQKSDSALEFPVKAKRSDGENCGESCERQCSI